MKSFLRNFWPALSWLAISIVLLTLPGTAFPKQNWLADVQFDKWVHIGMFAVLCFLFCLGLYRSRTNGSRLLVIFIATGIASLAFGIIMEFVQRDYVSNRSFDAGDVVADGIGAAVGILVSWWRFIKK